ncbi:MAG: hypothetical protein Ta2G_08690 [Termitinemataceae bacterium]|nr:MAG: hypothetical protein Ta2G_08690 [Termitinemataceae bacterium]
MRKNNDSEQPQCENARKSGLTLRYKGISLLSAYNPIGQCEAAASSFLPLQTRTLYFCPSPLAGYGLNILRQNMPPNSALLCVEADEKLIEISKKIRANDTSDPDDTIENKNFLNVYTKNSLSLCKLIEEHFGARYFRRVVLVKLNSGYQVCPAIYEEMVSMLSAWLAENWSNAMTLTKLGRLFARNAIRNLPLLHRGCNAAQIDLRARNALVLGAGPSLDAGLEALGLVQNTAMEAISNILKTGKSVKVINKYVGEISIDAGSIGKHGYGLKHIIESRSKKDKQGLDEITALLYLIADTVRYGKIIKDEKFLDEKNQDKGAYILYLNGIAAIVSKMRFDNSEQFVLTGYADYKNKEEATGTIKAVIAQYGYAPDFVDFRNQVGAVISALGILSAETHEKSSAAPFIICVDTSLGALLQRGIKPDLVVALESQHWNLRDFVGAHKECNIAMDISALPQSAEFSSSSPYIFYTKWAPLKFLERLKEGALLPLELQALGSVGLSAVDLALKLGAQNVLCAGLDFSFTMDKYHCRGSPSHKSAVNGATRFKSVFCAAAFRPATYAAIAKDGSTVLSDPAMKHYQKLFKAVFGDKGNVYTLCDGGLDLGVKVLNGEDARCLFRGTLNQRAPLNQSHTTIPAVSASALFAFIQTEINNLRELRDILRGQKEGGNLDLLIEQCDYLWAHFPECAGSGKAPLEKTQSFLKRVRVEIDPFLKLFEEAAILKT